MERQLTLLLLMVGSLTANAQLDISGPAYLGSRPRVGASGPPISWTSVMTNSSSVNGTTYATPSFQTFAGVPSVCYVIHSGSATTTAPTGMLRGADTWVQVTNSIGNVASVMVSMWLCTNTVTTNDALTVSFGATMTGCAQWVSNGTNAVGVIVQAGTNSAVATASVGVTLATPGALNTLIGCWGGNATSSVGWITNQAGFSIFAVSGYTIPFTSFGGEIMTNASVTTTAMTNSSLLNPLCVVAEIR